MYFYCYLITNWNTKQRCLKIYPNYWIWIIQGIWIVNNSCKVLVTCLLSSFVFEKGVHCVIKYKIKRKKWFWRVSNPRPCSRSQLAGALDLSATQVWYKLCYISGSSTTSSYSKNRSIFGWPSRPRMDINGSTNGSGLWSRPQLILWYQWLT